ncbi:hypothetical protein GGD66_007173 [Bradyrhizobium sp. CIR48]|uniref:hypothetical protein n=1 Tax=unclassified Bradyrhizobium TaxID=2631580 RepID=UPI001160139F|nr:MULTISPECIES: hypothetical protein [unclassified Bradyrhizobium]MBB4379630.1 hypothetical protein [Bradyrhizobium sp. SBR1B]MBB4428583.1 hypothetical protein [Bradyrhizobium sp. CIR48]
MKNPEFRLSYMAILAGLASDLRSAAERSAMTHLSWDEFRARVLERRSSPRTGMRGRAQAGLGLGGQGLADEGPWLRPWGE